MKKKVAFCVEVMILGWFLSLQTNGQSSPVLSVYYNYSIRYETGEKLQFPVGLGTSLIQPLNERFTLNAGFGYSFGESSIQIFHDNFFDPPNKSLGKVRESSIFLTIGLYYRVLKINDYILIKIGANLAPSYSKSKTVITNYYDTYESLVRRKKDSYSIAINPVLRVEYVISNRISVFLEPGFSYYVVGDYSRFYALNGIAGLNIFFK